jgi:hypothetical protein
VWRQCDTHWSTIMSRNGWEQSINSGAYQPAASTEAHAFMKIEDSIWSDLLDESKDEEEAAAPIMPLAEEPPATRAGPPT